MFHPCRMSMHGKSIWTFSKLSQYDAIPTAEFLQTYDFGAMLREFKGGEGRDFQDRCREFIDRFVELILAQQAASSGFSSSLYCFCPELLLEGDDKHVFDMFNRLARHLERCGVISDIECESAVEEFRTFVVDVRGRHAASGELCFVTELQAEGLLYETHDG